MFMISSEFCFKFSLALSILWFATIGSCLLPCKWRGTFRRVLAPVLPWLPPVAWCGAFAPLPCVSLRGSFLDPQRMVHRPCGDFLNFCLGSVRELLLGGFLDFVPAIHEGCDVLGEFLVLVRCHALTLPSFWFRASLFSSISAFIFPLHAFSHIFTGFPYWAVSSSFRAEVAKGRVSRECCATVASHNPVYVVMYWLLLQNPFATHGANFSSHIHNAEQLVVV